MSQTFNEKQLQAINHFEGAAVVIAAPGSGKTTVIANRTKTLITKYKVSASNILVVTFTKMAALQMKERFHELMKDEIISMNASVTFGTFHSVFFKILKHAYNYSASDIIKEEEQRNIIRQCILKYNLEVEDENELVTQILAEISRVKSELIDPDYYYSICCSENIFRRIYEDYTNTLLKYRKIDFDDMLVYCYELLKKRQDILKAWKNKYKYILIDEFQDINKVQYDIVKMLTGDEANLFVVGDDDQSIYGFRGSKPEIMLGFKKDYPDAKIIKLDINYRSTPQIVSVAKKVIEHNKKRYDKDLQTYNEEGRAVDICNFEDMQSEYLSVVDNIVKSKKDKNINYSDIAVLTRTNIGARGIVGKFIEYNIPFITKDAIPNIYEHWIAKNLFAYIKIARGNYDRNVFLQIINKPKRYISRDMLMEEKVDFSLLRERYSDKKWMVERIDDLEGDLRVLSRCSPLAAINYIRRGIGYDCYLREYAKEHRINEDDLFNIINEIQESSKEFQTFEEWFGYIENYVNELKAQNQKKTSDYEKPDAVIVSTMHSAKGLEYDEVFIIDVNEGVTPYSKSVLDDEIEEERRMFYVAMTRAKKMLHLYYTNERFNKKCEISRFLEEINDTK